MSMMARMSRAVLPYLVGAAVAALLGILAISMLNTVVGMVILGAGAAWLVYGILAQIKSGNARLELDRPATPGEPLRGRIFTGLRVAPVEIRLHLYCVCNWTEILPTGIDVRVSPDGTPKLVIGPGVKPFGGPAQYDHGRRTLTVWEERQTLTRKALGGSPSGFTIAVSFDLPTDARVSGEMEGRHYKWQLDVSADTPGIDFATTFDVNVAFPTRRSFR